VQQLALLRLAAVGDDLFQRLRPAAVGGVCAEQADRPVPTKYDPIRAEAVEAVVDRRRQVGGGPAGAGAGDDAGDFADGVGQRGQRVDAVLPLLRVMPERVIAVGVVGYGQVGVACPASPVPVLPGRTPLIR